ncbi:hypothetical protein [Caulobacter sp. CCG-8]|uniref:hypothetical protein n=1 Tax=Caulobacter sp. CCG-8 TaxID=3127958 RepID=UPI00307F46C8
MIPSAFPRFLDVMLPGGGWALTVSEAYIDESYSDRDPKVLCIAGYLFRKTRAVEFTKEWRRYLKARGLPYFHTNELSSSKPGSLFADCDKDALCRKLIHLTHDKAAYGFAVTVNEDEYREIVSAREGMPTAYAFALKACIGMVRRWKEKNQAEGPTAFFFEQGHKHQGDAHAFLSWLLEVPEIAAKYGYNGHAFVPKHVESLHPADYLAWQWRLEAVRKLDPNRKYPPRADLRALLRDTDEVRSYTRGDLVRLEAALKDLEVDRHATREAIRMAQEAAALG